jgi:nitroimidazol reductase NimA-like FMN-containing flavoprotein (pyridoxamine 5'-phosphate oxidase superfamily)
MEDIIIMRRKDREVSSMDEIIKIIDKCKVCRIAMNDGSRPYIVPLNFGYEFENNALTLFFHSAAEGRKIDILKANNFVCFEADCSHALVESDIACRNGFLYESVIGEGRVAFIAEPAEKEHALNAIMKHQCGRTFTFNKSSFENLTVYKIDVTSVSGKKCV